MPVKCMSSAVSFKLFCFLEKKSFIEVKLTILPNHNFEKIRSKVLKILKNQQSS